MMKKSNYVIDIIDTLVFPPWLGMLCSCCKGDAKKVKLNLGTGGSSHHELIYLSQADGTDKQAQDAKSSFSNFSSNTDRVKNA